MILIESLVFLTLLLICAPLLGIYMAQAIAPRENAFPRLQTIENFCWGVCKIDPNHRMNWVEYLKAVLLLHGLSFILLFLLLMYQDMLPWNPQSFKGLAWPLAFNIAVSYVTNTNWQSFAGETTLSYFSQMMLTIQNFFSAATGLAVLLALIRGLKKSLHETLGNFWCDLTRTIFFLLLPLALLFSLILMQQGVVQTLDPYAKATTLEQSTQIIPLGPAASNGAIKLLAGGGGTFYADSAHPFENPTPLTNFLGIFAFLLIPAATVFAYGVGIDSRRQGWMIFLVMLVLLVNGLIIATLAEKQFNPDFQIAGSMEGKEVRNGAFNSIAWTTLATATSNGSYNAMIDSLSPLTSGIALYNMLLGEVIFGGIGTGLCHMIMYILMAVFLAGLMIGRTPEYLGKKIETREIQWVIAAIFIPPACILIGLCATFAFYDVVLPNGGPHRFTEVIYAFASTAANNGSQMASFTGNTPFFQLIFAAIMAICRFTIITASLGLAGNLVVKKIMPDTSAMLNTSSTLFGILVFAVIIGIGSFIFMPFISLGPLMEYLLMLQGVTT